MELVEALFYLSVNLFIFLSLSMLSFPLLLHLSLSVIPFFYFPTFISIPSSYPFLLSPSIFFPLFPICLSIYLHFSFFFIPFFIYFGSFFSFPCFFSIPPPFPHKKSNVILPLLFCFSNFKRGSEIWRRFSLEFYVKSGCSDGETTTSFFLYFLFQHSQAR